MKNNLLLNSKHGKSGGKKARSLFISTILHEKQHLATIIVAWFRSAWQQRRRGIDAAAVPLDWCCFKLRTVLIVSGGFQRQPLHEYGVDRTTTRDPRTHPSQSGSANCWGWIRFQGPGRVPVESTPAPSPHPLMEENCFHFTVKAKLKKTFMQEVAQAFKIPLRHKWQNRAIHLVRTREGRRRWRGLRPECRHTVRGGRQGEQTRRTFLVIFFCFTFLFTAGFTPGGTLGV